jgi:hypothetical protein
MLREHGHVVAHDGRMRFCTLRSYGSDFASWAHRGEVGVCGLSASRRNTEDDFDLLVRMDDRFQPSDLLLLPQTWWSDFRNGLSSKHPMSSLACGSRHQMSFSSG